MSERSSLRDAFMLAAAVLAAAGCKAKKLEADPARAKDLAAAMIKNIPVPAAVPDCKPGEATGSATMTFRTLMQLAGNELSKEHELDDWVNPTNLDHPSARALVDATTDDARRRQAAGELTNAPSYFIYKVDAMSAPIAAGRREAARGFVAMRDIKYDAKGMPVCVVIYQVKNTRSKAEWAMDQIEKKAVVDPAVVQALRDDMHEQQMRAIEKYGLPIPPPS